jgi:hypothetical protein
MWLQRLALLLPPAHTPPFISLADVSRLVPIPPVVLRYYGNVDRFTAATPGLFWNGPGNYISLHPALHQQLRATAAPQPPHLPLPGAGALPNTGPVGQYQHQYQQQQLGFIPGVRQPYLPATGAGGNSSKGPALQYPQQLAPAAGHQDNQQLAPATGVGGNSSKAPAGQQQQQQEQQKLSKRQRKKQQKQQQLLRQQQPLSASAAERKAQAERMEAEATAWMQRLALYLTPAVPPAEPPSIAHTTINKFVPIPQCLLDHFGSARAVMQSLTHLGLYWKGPLESTPHVRIHHAQHVELRAAGLAAGLLPPGPVPAPVAGDGWAAPADMPGQLAAEARGWLHWLAQRLPLTDTPQSVSCQLLRQEMPIPQPVLRLPRSWWLLCHSPWTAAARRRAGAEGRPAQVAPGRRDSCGSCAGCTGAEGRAAAVGRSAAVGRVSAWAFFCVGLLARL